MFHLSAKLSGSKAYTASHLRRTSPPPHPGTASTPDPKEVDFKNLWRVLGVSILAASVERMGECTAIQGLGFPGVCIYVSMNK